MHTPAEIATWVLLSLVRAAYTNEPVPLRELVKAADSINHAIISFEELEAGLTSLSRAGYVKCAPDESYVLTPNAREFVRSSAIATKPPLASWPMVSAHLGALPRQDAREADSRPCLSRSAYDQVIAIYVVPRPHPLWGSR